MTPEIALVLAILVGSVILFAWERFSPDIVAMLVLITLAVTGLVSPNDVFSGFSSPAVITVWAIYIVSEGLFRTGIADFLGANILKVAGAGQLPLVVIIMLTVGVMSAFMNNIGATAVLLPAIIGICKQTGHSPSKFLIPLAFASLMGGNMTLIGTPPNILAAGILQEYAPELAFGFFSFLPMGVIILLAGTAYMALFGRHLLPDAKHGSDLTKSYHLRNYATELKIMPGSPLIGKTIVESRFGEQYDLTIISKISESKAKRLPSHLSSTRRLGGNSLPVKPTETIQENDIFLVQGKLENILKIKSVQSLELGTDIKLSDADLATQEAAIAEIIITTTSSLAGKTIKEAQFREKFGLTVLAVWRSGHSIRQKLAETMLQFGDVLLVQGTRDQIDLTRNDPDLLVLEPVPYERRRSNKASVSLVIMGAMLLAVTLGGVHISLAAVTAAVAMVITKIMSMDEAYQAIQWRSVFLIAGMLPLGIAMAQTGTAEYLADIIVGLTDQWGPMGVMLGIYVMTLLVTQPMSNAAATVLIAPIALDAAIRLNVNPQTFIMTVVIAASTAFLTPIGHQVNVLVYGVGGYKFSDFAKVGLGLNILYIILAAIFLPLIFPF